MEENSFKVRGKVHKVDIFTGKTGKESVTLVLSVERTDGRQPELIPIKFFGRNADEVRALSPGTVVMVGGSLGGHEWNGKFYGDNLGWKFKVEQDALPVAPAPATEPQKQGEDDVPF